MNLMARLIINTGDGGEPRSVDLHMGANYCGRGPDNTIIINHPTVSTVHCAITLGAGSLELRDFNSTNGTFLEGKQITEASLVTGQSFRIGDVEVLVESAEVNVAIPVFDIPRPAPPVVCKDGSMLCPRHEKSQVTHRCTFCKEVMCDECVHMLRRRGGKVLKLCPLCSHSCELIGGEKPKKGGFMTFLQKTVKLRMFSSKDPE